MPIIAVYALIAAVIFGAGAATGYKLTSNSFKADMLEAANEKVREQAEVAVEIGESVKRVQAYRDEQEQNLVEVINGKDKAISDLQKRERDALAANRGLFVSAPACVSQNGVPTNAGSSGLAGSGASRVRLSPQDEYDIRSAFGDAQRVVIQYNACRDKLKSLVRVAE